MFLTTGTGTEPWKTWLQQAANGCTSQLHISKAFLRDLSDPLLLDSNLAERYINMIKFCMLPQNVPFNVASERLTFWYALASHRRQLCSGTRVRNYESLEDPGIGAIEVAYGYAA